MKGLDSLLPTETGLFYDGGFHQDPAGTFDSFNPATGEFLATVTKASAGTVDHVVKRAADAQVGWAAMDVRERVACVRQFASAIEADAERLARIDALDSGNPYRGMAFDIRISLAVMDLFANLATEMKGETYPGGPSRLNLSIREPLGVVARIIPFNHPLMFACIKSVAPLIAGNAVIMKPSEFTPLSALRIAELASHIFPPGVFNVINGDRVAGSALSRHPMVRNVSLVGSVPTGRAVLADAATQVKSVLLELGGKNPLIVCEDTDVEYAVAQAVKGMNITWTAGQSCGSTSRLLVHASHYQAVLEGVTEAFAKLTLGMPFEASTEMGCITTPPQYAKVKQYLEIGRAEGAQMTTGGLPDAPPHAEGLLIRPTVFAGVTPEMRIAKEEIFGPVLSVMSWTDDAEVMSIANGLEYGLTAGILTNDINRALKMARQVQAGYVWVNNASDHYPGVPFGGYKDSGLGREECLEELLSYTQVKAINITIR